MNIENIDDIDFYWRQIFQALKKASKPLLEKHSLTKVDANILYMLSRNAKISKVELAQALSFKPSSLTRSLDRLVEHHYVTRISDDNDRRYVTLSLTEQGQGIINQYIAGMRSFWQKALAKMDVDNIQAFSLQLHTVFTTINHQEK